MSFDPVLAVRWAVEVIVLTALLAGLARVANNRVVTWITALSFTFRLALGQGLFFASLWGLPLARSLQLGNGFWTIATDSPIYHQEGLAAMNVLLGKSAEPVPHSFSWLIGIVYLIFGSSPTSMLLLNAAAAAACAPLAYRMAKQVGLAQGGATVATGLVAFWPSSFAWSSQLLKDPLKWLAMFCLLLAVGFFLGNVGKARPRLLPSLWSGLTLLFALRLAAVLQGGYELPSLFLAAFLAILVHLLGRASLPIKGRAQGVLCSVLPVLLLLGGMSAWNAIVFATTAGTAGAGQGAHCPTLQGVVDARTVYLQSGGATLEDENAQFTSCREILMYAPRAYFLFLLAPPPQDWIRPGASTGGVARFAALDAGLLWMLFPGAVAALIAAFRDRDGARLLVVIYVLVVGFILGLAVANFGTLFRLRLLGILPGIILAADGWQVLLSWLLARRTLSSTDAIPGGLPDAC